MGRIRRIKHSLGGMITRLKNINGNPRDISLGMALGVFVGTTPFFPFHTSIALVLAIFLGGSRIAAAAGVWISNPITLPFFYVTTYKIGAFFLGTTKPVSFSTQSFSELIHMGLDLTQAMILGGIILGSVLSVVAYFLTFRIVVALKNRRATESL